MVLVKGKKRRDTVLIVLADDSIEDSKVRINKGKFQGILFYIISRSAWIMDMGKEAIRRKMKRGDS